MTEQLYVIRDLPNELGASAASVTGTRNYQEDCLMYQILDDGVLGVVCDGMGGLAHGERSSACAVDALASYFGRNSREHADMDKYWETAIHELDNQVAALKNEEGEPLGGGTTLAAVFFQNDLMTFAAAGDSMIYHFRKGKCTRLVRMHNYFLVLEEQLKKGLITREDYEAETGRGEALISYLGMDGVEICDFSREALVLEPGDRILLCSDGLYKGLSQERIQEIVENSPDEEFEETALKLIKAIFTGKPQRLDNISILCFLYRGNKDTREKQEENRYAINSVQ